MKKYSLNLVVIVLIFFFTNCSEQKSEISNSAKSEMITDPLPSWNEGKVKADILSFVKEVCNQNSEAYVKVEDRIAVFDNDGTLWSEQPAYFQLFFALDRLKKLAPNMDIPEDSPLNSILNGDMETFAKSGEKGILELVITTHSGMTTEEFENSVVDWISSAKHPSSGKLYTEMVYHPMLELLDLLEENEFKTFIVSGGGIDFMRPWVEEVYGIPKERVIGSSIKKKFTNENGEFQIQRIDEIEFIDDKEAKPIGIQKHIGRKPIFCAGNSDGDLQMMQWTSSNNLKNMMLYIHHTDSIREWSYDRNSHIGRFDKALDEAKEKQWTIVDMKSDWNKIYPFE